MTDVVLDSEEPEQQAPGFPDAGEQGQGRCTSRDPGHRGRGQETGPEEHVGDEHQQGRGEKCHQETRQ